MTGPSKDTVSMSNEPPKRKRSYSVVLKVLAGFLGLGIVLVLGLAFYSTTNDFQSRVAREVQQVLEDSTGGRVDIGLVSFSLWHLAVEVDNLVIHGSEPADQMPYLSVAKIQIRLRINTFVTHLQGQSSPSRIGLSYLGVEQPHFHLIIDKNGRTNQPVPKHPSQSSEPIRDTLLDLQARDVELSNGLALVNDQAIPFDMAAKDLEARVAYLSNTDSYGIKVNLADLQTKMATQPAVQSKLALNAILGRDSDRKSVV